MRSSNDFDALSRQQLVDQMELMVEGELPADARRALLRRIEKQPEYWKLLALSYVEQQTIRSSVQSVCRAEYLAAQKTRGSLGPTANFPAGPERNSWLPGAAWVAACVLLAFALGYGAGNAPSMVTMNSSGDSSEAGENRPEIGGGTPEQSPGAGQENPAPEVSGGIVGYVEWMDDRGKQLSPVFDGSEIDAQWLEAHPPRVNQRMQQLFSRAGWQVVPARKLVSVKLSEGSRYTIPMDDIRYRYVGRQLF